MEALKEALLEILRIVILSVIPVAITALESGSLDYKAIGIVAAIAALRGIDKYLHETGKETENTTLSRGLTRF